MPPLLIANMIGEVVLAVIAGIRYKLLDTSLRYVAWLCFTWVFFTCLGFVIIKFFHQENLWMMALGTLVDFLFRMRIYSFWIKKISTKKLFLITSIMYIIFWSIAKYSFEPVNEVDTVTYTVAAIIQVIVSIVVLLQLFSESEFNWIDDARFWVAAGFFIHVVGTVLFFSTFASMLKISQLLLIKLYNINWIINLICYAFLIKGFYSRIDSNENSAKAETAPL